MKKRMLSVTMALSLLLALCPLPAALAVDLSGASVTVSGGNLVYNGQAQQPPVTVTLDGITLHEGTDYTLSYSNNKNAGQGTVTAAGTGAYSGSVSTTFVIEPYTLTEKDFEGQTPCVKTFGGGKDAAPTIRTTVFGETVTLNYASAEYTVNKFVGKQGVAVEGLSVDGNYQLSFDSLTIEGEILPLQTALTDGEVEQGNSLDLKELVQNGGKGNHYFEIQGEKLGASISGTVLTAGAQTGTIKIWASIDGYNVNSTEDDMDEYTGVQGVITVTVIESEQEKVPVVPSPVPTPPPVTQKQPQDPLVITGAKDITYGQTLQLSCSGGSTNGTVTWDLVDFTSSGEAAISPSGLVTPVKAGDIWVTATMAGNDAYQPVVANGVKITIRKAPVTITVDNKTAQVGDQVPVLTGSDYTVSGLVGNDKLTTGPTLSYGTTPDMSRAGEVAILASGAAVPAGGNYDPHITYVPGKLIIGAAYPITIAKAEGGTVTADMTQAPEGAKVTLTVRPEEGFVLDTLKVESGSMVIQTTEVGKDKVTFTMPDGGVLVTATFAPELPTALPFADVTEKDWFYESVAYVYQNGLMNGTSETRFTPNGTTTRGMIVTILYRLAGSPETAAWSPFQDVDPNQYYAAPIAWAAWNGIVNGKSATSFGPNDPITREQMAAILYRYASSRDMEVTQRGNLNQFSDQGKISSYAREALAWANGAGLITGKGGGILDPKGPAVRAQVAAIFQRFCEGNSQ